MQVLEADKVPSVIWLGLANKYLEHNKDEGFAKEFEIIWQFWKTGELI